MRHLSFLMLFLSAFLIWSCQSNEVVEPDAESDAVTLRAPEGSGGDKARPFKAVGYAYQVDAQQVCDGTMPRAAEGTGTGTHVGRYTVDISECLDMTTGIALGKAVHTVANGDLLVTDYVMQYIIDPEDPFAVQGIFTDWFINGEESTGRFAGATGTGTGTLVGDLEHNWMEWEVEGTIDF